MLIVWLVYFFFLFFFFFGFDENGFFLLLFSSLFVPNLFLFLFKLNRSVFVKYFLSNLLHSVNFFLVFFGNFELIKGFLLENFEYFFQKNPVLSFFKRNVFFDFFSLILKNFYNIFSSFSLGSNYVRNLYFRFYRSVVFGALLRLKHTKYLSALSVYGLGIFTEEFVSSVSDLSGRENTSSVAVQSWGEKLALFDLFLSSDLTAVEGGADEDSSVVSSDGISVDISDLCLELQYQDEVEPEVSSLDDVSRNLISISLISLEN